MAIHCIVQYPHNVRERSRNGFAKYSNIPSQLSPGPAFLPVNPLIIVLNLTSRVNLEPQSVVVHDQIRTQLVSRVLLQSFRVTSQNPR